MPVHPQKKFEREQKIPSGRFAVTLYENRSIHQWSSGGARVRFFRSLATFPAVMDLVENEPEPVLLFTDDGRRLARDADRERIRLEPVGVDILFQVGDGGVFLSVHRCFPVPEVNPAGRLSSPVRIAFISVQDRKDIRWKNIGIPSSAHVVMGSLRKNGFVTGFHRVFTDDPAIGFIGGYDAVAIGVYEDLFAETIDLVRKIRDTTELPIILGGPLVSLAPEQVAAHCHDANAFLRGEVENRLPLLVSELPGLAVPERVEGLVSLSLIDGVLAAGASWGVSGHIGKNPRLHDFSGVELEYEKSGEFDAKTGLEYSTSRGCPRSCVFCSHIHGKKLRLYPDKVVEKHLAKIRAEFDRKAGAEGLRNQLFALNLNDDDLLLDTDRAVRILMISRSLGFRIWGIQTSVESLGHDRRRTRFFEEIAREDFFVGPKPLFWIGTDAFLTRRLKRLGKYGSTGRIARICADISASGFVGCHYWMITDADSDWAELVEELHILRSLREKYAESFQVLPNAATLIPYPGTPVYNGRVRLKQLDRIVLKEILSIPAFPEFDYPLVLHEKPRDDFLYAMVEPRALTAEKILADPRGFLDLIRNNRFDDAIMRCLSVLNREIPGLADARRKRELNAVRRRIRSYWPAMQDETIA